MEENPLLLEPQRTLSTGSEIPEPTPNSDQLPMTTNSMFPHRVFGARTAKAGIRTYRTNYQPKTKQDKEQAKPKLYAMKTENKIRRFIGRLIVSKHNIFTVLAFAHSANGTTLHHFNISVFKNAVFINYIILA